jgi:hydrogenase maturation protein HypF
MMETANEQGMNGNNVAQHLRVNGIVQGVGFRPYVYQLAVKFGLKGTVANTADGVFIHVEGASQAVEAFSAELAKGGPPLALIADMAAQSTPISGFTGFDIVSSRHQTEISTFISPDVGVCKDCLQELFDPQDHRFRYPFINCTHCGPRYTIINALPYDRPQTAMKAFAMCEPCQAEYDDPANRRFHAQPNACPDCGPNVALYDRDQNAIIAEDPISLAADYLKQGHILAVKGIGGFHLAVNAENDEAVFALRERKKRPNKPFAVMTATVEAAKKFARISPEESRLLSAAQRPIVLLEKSDHFGLSQWVAPENHLVGVMLPYAPLHHLLMKDCGLTALIMTSGNLSSMPLCVDSEDAFEKLSPIADFFLIHNRDIYHRCDDSLMRYMDGTPRQLRRSRGYAPAPVMLNKKGPSILAVGALLKNTFCLTKDAYAFISSHMGDLEELETYVSFEAAVDHIKKVLAVSPEVVAYDMHPDYLSSRYALSQACFQKVPVQHHHAHVASCMVEHQLDGPVIGLALDGTGYGPDGAVWGGEVLVADCADFKRAAHLAYVALPGGEAAIRAPWRMGLSYLYDAFGSDLWALNLPFMADLDEAACRLTLKMIDKKLNAPPTSSLGRLFDGIAAITGLCKEVSFEGQAAMALETLAVNVPEDKGNVYAYEVLNRGDLRQVDVRPLIREVAADEMIGMPVAKISRKFHTTLIDLFLNLCKTVYKDTQIRQVVLSGGVFQNAILLTGLSHALENEGFEVFSHKQVPTNDGGICLGQAAVAMAKLQKSEVRSQESE